MFINTSLTARSGTIAAGGTPQVFLPRDGNRRGFWIQNLSSGDLWLGEAADMTAAQPSLKIPPGALYEAPANGVPVEALWILGATTGQAFSARSW